VTRRTLAGLTAAAAVCALLVAPARAAQEPGTADAEVRRRIEQRLAKAGLDHRADIQVRVVEGAVRLTGVAVSYADYREAERAARKEARSVDNQLHVVPEEPRTDKAIRADASHEVISWERYGAFDAVSVEVRQGVVVLQGWVDTPVKKDEIEERLAHVGGVRDVHNDLRLQGFSEGDRRLRVEIYARIYGDPMFERWAGVPDPPVRIFVSRGRITLAGLVGSQVEKVTAGNIARSSLAFSVNNQLRIESEERRKQDSKKQAPDES
jgi:osmotically-inducible protein OsmY